MPPAGIEKQEWDSESGSTLRSSTLGKRHVTLQLPLTSQPSASMEDIPLIPYGPTHTPPVEERSRLARPRRPINDDYNSLLMPTPHIGQPGERYGDGGLRGEDHEYEMGMGGGGRFQEDNTYDVLDYTHFDGDVDAQVPGEESLSRILKQQGTARRKMTRRATMGLVSRNSSTSSVNSWVTSQDMVASPVEDTNPLPLPSPHSPEDEEGGNPPRASTAKTYEESTTETLTDRISFSSHLRPGELGLRDPSKLMDEKEDTASIRGSIMDVSAVQSLMPNIGMGARGEEIKLQFSDEELTDVLAMTEYAWPGRPMLGKLLQEEVETARGAVVVACGCLSSFSPIFRNLICSVRQAAVQHR